MKEKPSYSLYGGSLPTPFLRFLFQYPLERAYRPVI